VATVGSSGLLSLPPLLCRSRSSRTSTLPAASSGWARASGKKLENLNSSLGSPCSVVSGCCWKKCR
jgi:hypothetical protein